MSGGGISDEQKAKFVRGYLGMFRRARPTASDRKWFSEHFPSPTSIYCVGDKDRLFSVGAMALISWGKRTRRMVESYALIDIWLGNIEDDIDTFYGFEESLVIVYHFSRTVENRQLENVIIHMVTSRTLHQKPTLVLSECPLPKVEAAFREQGWPVADGGETRHSEVTGKERRREI